MFLKTLSIEVFFFVLKSIKIKVKKKKKKYLKLFFWVLLRNFLKIFIIRGCFEFFRFITVLFGNRDS